MSDRAEEVETPTENAGASEAVAVQSGLREQPAADSIDSAIAEYDAAVKPASPVNDAEPDLQQEAIAALRAMDAPQTEPALDALRGENAALRAHITREADQAEFKQLADSVQRQLPEHLPGDYAQTQLLAMAATNPDLTAAFDLRHVDRRAVDAELRKVESALAQVQRDPAADQAKVAALVQYGYRLGLALNAQEIIRRATAGIVKRGKAHNPIDAEATVDRELVAQTVRGAGGKIEPEPPPNFGNMSDKQFERYTREHYGY
jgi:hypothetical protein